MCHQMSKRQRELVTLAIENANPCPQDIDDCLDLLEKEKILTMKKARTFWGVFLQVCQQAMDARNARDARPPSPPTSGISPPSSADPVPSTLLHADRADGALLAAAHDSRKKVGNVVAEKSPTKLTWGITRNMFPSIWQSATALNMLARYSPTPILVISARG